MLIPKQNLKVVYEKLFNDGVLIAKKDFNAPKHAYLEVPNLQVIKALQSLKSRGYVTEQFSWQYYYWYLTNEGIEFLKKYLHLPAEIVPETLKPKTKAPSSRFSGREDRPYRGDRPPRDGDREGYRRRPQEDGEKKVGPAGDFKPEFRGGFGRGPRREAEAQ